jgi:hypothetical protein
MVVHACHVSYGGKCKMGRSWFKLTWAKRDLTSKITRAKRTRSVAQIVEHLLSKLNPSQKKRKRIIVSMELLLLDQHFGRSWGDKDNKTESHLWGGVKNLLRIYSC